MKRWQLIEHLDSYGCESWVPFVGPIDVDECFWIPDDVVPMRDEAIELWRRLTRNHAQAPPVALNFEGNAGLEHLIE